MIHNSKTQGIVSKLEFTVHDSFLRQKAFSNWAKKEKNGDGVKFLVPKGGHCLYVYSGCNFIKWRGGGLMKMQHFDTNL